MNTLVRAKAPTDTPSDGGAAAKDGLVQLELSQAERAANAAQAQATLAAAAVKRVAAAADAQRTWYADYVARLQAEVKSLTTQVTTLTSQLEDAEGREEKLEAEMTALKAKHKEELEKLRVLDDSLPLTLLIFIHSCDVCHVI
jgi:chromosome segregation ATPase